MLRAGFRKLHTSSYRLHREHRLLRLSLSSLARRDHEPLLVYQMGKVGSTAVAHALETAMPGRPVFHFHTLSRERLQREEAVYRRHFAVRRSIDSHLLHSLHVKRRLAGLPPRVRRWKIVTLVRDPVERNLSAFFQTLGLHFADRGFTERIHAGDDRVADDLRVFFVEHFPHRRVLSWFDDEIRAVFGIDVLEGAFPHGTGYRLYSGAVADVLLLRLENLSVCASDGLRELLGLRDVAVSRRKKGSDKYYAETYRRVRETLSLPPDVVEAIYGSRMVQTLYEPAEIEARRRQWSRH